MWYPASTPMSAKLFWKWCVLKIPLTSGLITMTSELISYFSKLAIIYSSFNLLMEEAGSYWNYIYIMNFKAFWCKSFVSSYMHVDCQNLTGSHFIQLPKLVLNLPFSSHLKMQLAYFDLLVFSSDFILHKGGMGK